MIDYKFDDYQHYIIKRYSLRHYVEVEDVIDMMVVRLKKEMQEEDEV